MAAPGFSEGSIEGIPVFTRESLARVCVNIALGLNFGNDWNPVPEDERTEPGEPSHVVATGKDWEQYSDGITCQIIQDPNNPLGIPTPFFFEELR